MGGQINIVTRSGSSQYHASAYEFFRNDVLNANDTFSNRAGLPRGRVRHNQFGGTLGGPIWKRKHFFFVNTELLRNQEGSETRPSNVPAAAERAGVLEYTDAGGVLRTLNLSSRLTPLSARLMGLYPLPNSSGGAGNYTASLAIGLQDYQYHARTDHYLTTRDIVTMRTSWNLNDQVYIIDRFGGPYIPGFPLPNPERTANGTIAYLHTFSPMIVNTARLGVNRYGNNLANGDQRNAAEFGLPNGSGANGIPSIVFAQGGLAGLGALPWYNREQNELTVYASDTVSVLKGSHSLKFGVDVSRYHFNTRGATDQRGSIYFDGSRNGLIPVSMANAKASVLADLVLGLPFQATITVGDFGRGYRQWAAAGFAQDSWRAARRLTLDYGVRYEHTPAWTEVNDKLSNFIPGLGLVTPKSPAWDGLYRASHFNFGPRVGFAYDLTGASKTVVRGGFGILHETLLQASTVQQIENNPPISSSAITNSPSPFAAGSGASTLLLELRNSAQPSTSIAAVPARLATPYRIQFSFDVQHSVGPDWLVELGYRGARGVHLPYDVNINQVPVLRLTGALPNSPFIADRFRPYPGFNSIELFDNAATSTYQGLQVRVERRVSRGVNVLAAYTWSKSIDDATDFASSDPSEHVLNSYDRRRQRAVSSFDVPHRFTAAFHYALPAAGPRWLISGWQVNGILTVQSGQPFTPYTSQFDPYRNESFNRLRVVGDPNANVPAGRAYNPVAFAAPAIGTFGESGRNIVRGDGYLSADLSVFRTLSVAESARLQLRFEAQNALNQVNYQGPVTDQATSPGLFVAAAPPRTVQLGVKLSF